MIYLAALDPDHLLRRPVNGLLDRVVDFYRDERLIGRVIRTLPRILKVFLPEVLGLYHALALALLVQARGCGILACEEQPSLRPHPQLVDQSVFFMGYRQHLLLNTATECNRRHVSFLCLLSLLLHPFLQHR